MTPLGAGVAQADPRATTPLADSTDGSGRAGAEGASGTPSEHWYVEADGALAMSPSFGTGLPCDAPCTEHPPLGVALLGHGGVVLPSGFGFGLDAGYLSATSTLNSRSVSLHPVNLTDNAGNADDTLRLSGILVGASALFHTKGTVPVLVRFGAGALLGNLRDERKGGASTNERANPSPAPGEPSTFPATSVHTSSSAWDSVRSSCSPSRAPRGRTRTPCIPARAITWAT